MSYIIKNNEIIAKTTTTHKSGELVKYSHQKTAEKINATRRWTLVNAIHGKISNAKKWDIAWLKMEHSNSCIEINTGEFEIY